jgi:putative ABC transport system permease protein
MHGSGRLGAERTEIATPPVDFGRGGPYRAAMLPRALALTVLLALALAPAPAEADPAGGGPGVGEILLSERAASALGAVAGDTLEAAATATFGAPERYRVAGVYRPQADPVEVGRDSRYVRMHLEDLERLSGQRDAVQRFVLRLRVPAHAAGVRDRLNAAAVGFDAYTSDELAERSSATFVVISRFQRAIAWLTLAAGAVFLVTLMVLKVEERRRDLAALRLMGISRRTIVSSLVIESLLVALAGGVAGVGLGALASAAINAYFRGYYRTDLVFSEVSPAVALTAVGVALPLGVAAAALAAWRLLGRSELTRGAR